MNLLPGTQGWSRRNFDRRFLRCSTFSTSSGPSIAENIEAPSMRNKKYPVKNTMNRSNPRLVRVMVPVIKKDFEALRK